MSYPPNSHLAAAFHSGDVHRKLMQRLTEIADSLLRAGQPVSSNTELSRSVVITNTSTFEVPYARCLSVQFSGAKAHIDYDNFSHEYNYNKDTTISTHDISLEGMTADDAVTAIVDQMAAMEEIFGYQVREHKAQRAENIARAAEIRANSMGPSAWS